MIAGLRVAKKLNAKMVEVFLDSRLVVSQMEESFEARNPQMVEYLKMEGALLDTFQQVKVS